jgi:hypothetical protein
METVSAPTVTGAATTPGARNLRLTSAPGGVSAAAGGENGRRRIGARAEEIESRRVVTVGSCASYRRLPPVRAR